MTNETIFLGACPIIRPEGIYLDGRKVIQLGMGGVGLGDVGDLLAYRQEWEPFISAHLGLWRYLNGLLESIPDAQKCPAGIFDPAQINNLDSTTKAFCASLDITRMRISDTDPTGILEQWNKWSGTSSADMVAGAAAMLKWHQDTVMRVAGPYKDQLLQIAKLWKIEVQLPDVPEFSLQQQIIARIEGAYITTKGVVQILGYGVGEVLEGAADVTQATAQGLKETVKGVSNAVTSPWTWFAATLAVSIVAGAVIVYYVPRRTTKTA